MLTNPAKCAASSSGVWTSCPAISGVIAWSSDVRQAGRDQRDHADPDDEWNGLGISRRRSMMSTR